MGVIIGFVVGYLFGARSGPDGLAEIQHAWREISSSEEMKDIVEGLLSVGRDLARQGAGSLAQRLATADGPTELKAA